MTDIVFSTSPNSLPGPSLISSIFIFSNLLKHNEPFMKYLAATYYHNLGNCWQLGDGFLCPTIAARRCYYQRLEMQQPAATIRVKVIKIF